MTHKDSTSIPKRWLRIAAIGMLVVALVGGAFVLWPAGKGHQVVAYFPSTVGLYPGDDVRVVGVPVGKIESIQPRAGDVKVTMRVDDGVKLPADARALIIAPNLVSARFIQFTPAYKSGPTLADGAQIGLDRTGVPVEWDDVKEQLTQLSASLGPQAG